MAKQVKGTVIRLARPVEDGPRVVDEVTIIGETGPSQFPLMRTADGTELDMLAVQRVMASRTGLSEVAVSRLSGLDFFGIYFVLFIAGPPNPPANKRR